MRDAANREGIPNAGGGRWNSKRVHDVLTNLHYAGAIAWGAWTDDPVMTPGAHRGIVEPGEFDRVQELLRSRVHTQVHPRHAGSRHAFSGLLKCGGMRRQLHLRPFLQGRQGLHPPGVQQPEGGQGGLRTAHGSRRASSSPGR